MRQSRSQDLALELAERLNSIGPVTVTRFFGGAGLVRNGAQFGFVMQGVLYLKVDDASRPAFIALGAAPFVYGTRAKTVKVTSYYEVPAQIADDAEELIRWATRASLASTPPKRATARRRAAAADSSSDK